MKSHYNGAGFFMNDDRASGGKLEEDDLVGCCHCSRPVKKAKWSKLGGMCFVCAKPLCFECYERTSKYGCDGPLEKRIIAAVNDLVRKQQNERILGV